jgi:hypothetical protein
VIERIPSRRLVVLGEPGAGKSVLAMHFIVAALRGRVAGPAQGRGQGDCPPIATSRRRDTAAAAPRRPGAHRRTRFVKVEVELGMGFVCSGAMAKVINPGSNFGALVFFGSTGNVMWGHRVSHGRVHHRRSGFGSRMP